MIAQQDLIQHFQRSGKDPFSWACHVAMLLALAEEDGLRQKDILDQLLTRLNWDEGGIMAIMIYALHLLPAHGANAQEGHKNQSAGPVLDLPSLEDLEALCASAVATITKPLTLGPDRTFLHELQRIAEKFPESAGSGEETSSPRSDRKRLEQAVKEAGVSLNRIANPQGFAVTMLYHPLGSLKEVG